MADVPFTTEHLLAGLRHEADLVVKRGVVTTGQRLVICDLLIQAADEIARLREHSVVLNRVAWRLHEAMGVIPEGASEYFGDLEGSLDGICTTLRDHPALLASYDALVANSSAEHQRMSDLLQALSTNVIRLDEQHEQDVAIIAALESSRDGAPDMLGTTIRPGARVTQRSRFGRPGTVVCTYGNWVAVIWDEYPADHAPCLHRALDVRATSTDRSGS